MRRASSTGIALASARIVRTSRIARRVNATRVAAMDRRSKDDVSRDDDLKVIIDENAPSTSTSTRDRGRVADEEARASLLAWYDANARDLPWRRRPKSTQRAWIQIASDAGTPPKPKTEDEGDDERSAMMWRDRAFETDEHGRSRGMPDDQYAYGVLVSEIMSQQTQIERVAEYWRRWTRRWPTATALSRVQTVLQQLRVASCKLCRAGAASTASTSAVWQAGEATLIVSPTSSPRASFAADGTLWHRCRPLASSCCSTN